MYRKLLLLIGVLLAAASGYCKSTEIGSGTSPRVVYQFPKNSDKYIEPGSTLIIRLEQSLASPLSISDFTFDVRGTISGEHPGKIIVADDHRTIIFEPAQPFFNSESVHVVFTANPEFGMASLEYTFEVTGLSKAREEELLREFEKNYESERAAFRSREDHRLQNASAYFPLDTLPSSFPAITIDRNSPGTAPGTIFIAPNGSQNSSLFSYAIMTDNTGAPLYWKLIPGHGSGTADFKVQPNGKMTFPIALHALPGDLGQGIFYEMDSSFTVIDTFQMKNGLTPDVHDFELLPNNHCMFGSYSAVQIGPSTVFDNVIQIQDASRNVIFQWRALDHFRVGDATWEDTLGVQIDFGHMNSFQTDTDGNVLVSFRNLDEVAKIDPLTGNVIWHLGGKHNQFTFLGDTLKFSHQHDARRIANGHMTLWDNGNYHSVYVNGSPTIAPSSRAIEYDLDEKNHTITAVWQFKNVPFSDAAGNVQRLPNGNTFIGLGDISSPTAMEVEPGGDILFQLSLPYQTVSYRAYRFNFEYSLPKTAVTFNTILPGFAITSISPNPATNEVRLVFTAAESGNICIHLADLLGHRVSEKNIFVPSPGIYSSALETENLPNGTYLCSVSSNKSTNYRSLIIRR